MTFLHSEKNTLVYGLQVQIVTSEENKKINMIFLV